MLHLDPQAGVTLGRYEILMPVAQGGMMYGSPAPVPIGYDPNAYDEFLPSDERGKTPPRGASSEASQFAGNLHGYEFRYKPGVAGEDPSHERYGVMAQDVERTPMGRSFVVDTPGGKMLDIKHGFGASLAVHGDHERRLRALEAGGR